MRWSNAAAGMPPLVDSSENTAHSTRSASGGRAPRCRPGPAATSGPARPRCKRGMVGPVQLGRDAVEGDAHRIRHRRGQRPRSSRRGVGSAGSAAGHGRLRRLRRRRPGRRRHGRRHGHRAGGSSMDRLERRRGPVGLGRATSAPRFGPAGDRGDRIAIRDRAVSGCGRSGPGHRLGGSGQVGPQAGDTPEVPRSVESQQDLAQESLVPGRLTTRLEHRDGQLGDGRLELVAPEGTRSPGRPGSTPTTAFGPAGSRIPRSTGGGPPGSVSSTAPLTSWPLSAKVASRSRNPAPTAPRTLATTAADG